VPTSLYNESVVVKNDGRAKAFIIFGQWMSVKEGISASVRKWAISSVSCPFLPAGELNILVIHLLTVIF